MASLNDLRLELIKQTSIQEEKVTKNGQTYNAHVVVKNSPFQIVYGLRHVGKSHQPVDFNKFSFDIKLVYDVENEREVHFVSQKPVDCKPTITEAGDQLSLDGVKIKVLSSHHEDNLFKIKLSVWETGNLSCVPLCLLSQPIKVISKPIKHRNAPKAKSAKGEAKFPSPRSKKEVNGYDADSLTEEELSQEVLPTPGKKRTYSDRVESKMDMLLLELQKTREELAGFRGSTGTQTQPPTQPPSHLHTAPLAQDDFLSDAYYELMSTTPPPKKVKKEETDVELAMMNPTPPPEMKDTLEVCIHRILQAFSSLTEQETRAEQVKNILRHMSARDAHTLVEMIDVFSVALSDSHKVYSNMSNHGQLTQNFESPITTPGQNASGHLHSVNCAMGECPYKQEALFYNEIFFNGD